MLCASLLVFLIALDAYRDRDHVDAANSGKLTIVTGDQDDAIPLAPASNMTATDLEVSEIAVHRHRCHRLAHSHTLKIHGHSPGIIRVLARTCRLTWDALSKPARVSP